MLKRIITIICVAVLFILVAGYVLLYTSAGNEELVKYIFSRYGDIQNLQIGPEGNIGEGITLRNIELADLKGLPEGSRLKVQELFVHLKTFGLGGLTVRMDNARLKLPGSDPILMTGTVEGPALDWDIFSRGITVREVMTYLPDLKALIPLKGGVNSVDLYVKGSFDEPKITGNFGVKEFVYKGFVLSDSFWHVNVRLKDIKGDIKVFGRVAVDEGTLRSDKVEVKLTPGYIDFSGAWDAPEFHLRGVAAVEKVRISISVRGTLDDPELNLTSVPPYSKQKLMVMLATGKSWQSVESTMDTGVLSPDLTGDFIDYFFFAGKANAFAKQFGVRDVTVTLKAHEQGVGAKKDLTDKLEVGYGVEQHSQDTGEKSVTQKVGGAYKVTDQISVGVEKEVTRKTTGNPALDEVNSAPVTDDKVYLEYKKEF